MARTLCIAALIAVLATLVAAGSTVEPWPFDASGRAINILDGEFRIPLYDWTYNEGKTWRSSYNDKWYQVPDQMVAVDQSDIMFDTYQYNFGNVSQVKAQKFQEKRSAFGIPFFGITIGRMSAKRTQHIKELLKDMKSELYVSQKDMAVYSVASWANPMLSSRFLNKLRALPRGYNASAYKEFLDYAGTHYFTQGTFGGQVIFYIKVNEEIYKYMKKSEVSRQVGAFIGVMCIKLGFMSGTETSNLKVSETFSRYAKATCEVVPGDGYIKDCEKLTGFYKDWVTAVLNQPTLLDPRIFPLSQVLQNAAIPYKGEIRTNLDRAIASYQQDDSLTRNLDEDVAFLSAKRAADADFAAFQSEQSRKRSLVEVAASPIDVVPGYRYLGMGYDLVTDEYRVLPVVLLNNTSLNPNSTPNPNPKLVCEYQGCYSEATMNCWTDPLHRNRSYVLPKGVCLALVGTAESQLGSNAYMSRDAYESYYDRRTSHKGTLGIKRSSHHVHNYRKKFYQEDMALAISQIWAEKYTLSLNALIGIPSRDLPIHPRLVEAIRALPSEYIAKDYRDFLTRFGSHFVFDVTLGSSLTSWDWFHRCLGYTYGDKFSKSSSSTNLLVYSKKSESFNSNGVIDAKWYEYSHSLVQFVGGNPFMYTADKYDAWLPTTAENPAPVSQTVEPIYEIVHRIDASKARNMEKAWDAYMAESKFVSETAEKILKTLDPPERPSWCKNYPANT